MPLQIGKSIVYHPHNTSSEALGTIIRVTTRMYSYIDDSTRRIWQDHLVEATLCDASPPPSEHSTGASAYMSSKDQYIFVLNPTADFEALTSEPRQRYATKVQRQLAEYEADEQSAVILARMREYASTPPTLYLKARASDHIIATGDNLSIHIMGDRTIYELLGYVTDIEVL